MTSINARTNSTAAMTSPVRLQLSRRKGFELQALSVATNGLQAVNVARPSKFGNPVTRQDFERVQAISADAGEKPFPGTWRDHAVKCFSGWVRGMIPELGTPPSIERIRSDLHGKNLACWCPPDQPCHADVLLGLANPICEEVQP